MFDPGERSGDLYDSSMGDSVTGGSVDFDHNGVAGSDHHNVHGNDRHFSWDSDSDGNVSNVHGRVHGGREGNNPW